MEQAYSASSYGTLDIIGVSYKGTEYLFDCESYGGYKTEYWVINKEGGEWKHDHTVSLVRFN